MMYKPGPYRGTKDFADLGVLIAVCTMIGWALWQFGSMIAMAVFG